MIRTKRWGVPFAGSPWNEIVPGLWIGGHSYLDEAEVVQPAIVKDEFDVVISLFQREGHGPNPGVEHHYLDIPDGPLLPDQLAAVGRLAEITAAAVAAERQVLVRCYAGYNRSGLIAAQALIHLGHPVAEAISLIRDRRSTWALHNETFVDYLPLRS